MMWWKISLFATAAILSEDGFVLPIIAINKHSGKSEGLPEIVSRGFVGR